MPALRRPLLCLLSVLAAASLAGCTCGRAHERPGPGRFGIYTATLGGSPVRAVITHPDQQMTHPRVSPRGDWITFTRYTERDGDGLATESHGYPGSEIMLIRPDGSGLTTLVPAKEGLLNCNSNWTPDGRSLVWLSTETKGNKPVLKLIRLADRRVTVLPTPKGVLPSDPHIVGNQLVFSAVQGRQNALWLMNLDGKNARQITRTDQLERPFLAKYKPGDYDPKLSPDGKKVAFMRLHGREGWRVMVLDIKSGVLRDLSGAKSKDALPDWSADGKLLLFWHVNKENLPETGIYAMRPDGSERTMVPLPRGYLHGHPHFFPGAKAGPEAKIIFHAIKIPGLP